MAKQKTIITGHEISTHPLNAVVATKFNIDQTGISVDLNLAKIYAEKLAGLSLLIVVDFVDMLIHGTDFVHLMTKCYDYGWGLEISHTNQTAVLQYIVQQLMDKRKCSPETAQMVVSTLFPKGKFLKN